MICDVCGKEIKSRRGMKRYEERIVCGECRKLFPKVLREKDYSFSQIRSIIDYESSNQHFSCTAHTGYLWLDELNGLIAYCEKGKDSPKTLDSVFRIRDITSFSIELSDPVVQNRNVYCDILMSLTVDKNVVRFCKPIKKKVRCEYKRINDTKVKFEEPPEIVIVRNMINQMFSNSVAELRSLIKEQEFLLDKAKEIELKKAEILFMLDEGYSLDEAKLIYKKYMRAFHPDINHDIEDDYAQKINHAFEVIKENYGKEK